MHAPHTMRAASRTMIVATRTIVAASAHGTINSDACWWQRKASIAADTRRIAERGWSAALWLRVTANAAGSRAATSCTRYARTTLTASLRSGAASDEYARTNSVIQWFGLFIGRSIGRSIDNLLYHRHGNLRTPGTSWAVNGQSQSQCVSVRSFDC